MYVRESRDFIAIKWKQIFSSRWNLKFVFIYFFYFSREKILQLRQKELPDCQTIVNCLQLFHDSFFSCQKTFFIYFVLLSRFSRNRWILIACERRKKSCCKKSDLRFSFNCLLCWWLDVLINLCANSENIKQRETQLRF